MTYEDILIFKQLFITLSQVFTRYYNWGMDIDNLGFEVRYEIINIPLEILIIIFIVKFGG